MIAVSHPGIRATGASVISRFQNLFGLAAGPLSAGFLSDAWTLEYALMAMPVFSVLAAGALLVAARTYESDLQRAREAAESTARPAEEPIPAFAQPAREAMA